MKQISVKIGYKDKEYSDALAKAMSPYCKSISNFHDNAPYDLLIDEDTFPLYQPVSLIVNEIMAHTQGPAKSLNIPFYGFTAAVGGSGLTTTALCFARIRARLFDKKTGFVSFDPAYRNEFRNSDEFGIRYMDPAGFDSLMTDIQSDAGTELDELVLDIPSLCAKESDLLDMCEYRAVITGFDEKRIKKADALYEILAASERLYKQPPVTLLFANSYDNAPDPSDIHSQLGKEVLDLAKKLERLKT